MYSTEDEVSQRVLEHAEAVMDNGYNFVTAYAQGSWNYPGFSDEESDVDTKCLVLPSFRDIVLNKKPTSLVHVLPNNEHAEIKDIRLYFELLKKQNPTYLETLFTQFTVQAWKFSEPMSELERNRELIAAYDRYRLLQACNGQILQKQKALTHRYEGLKDKIDKYGYDGKQLTHALRLVDMMESLVNGNSFEEALKSSEYQVDFLVQLKRNKIEAINTDVAVEMMNQASFKAKEIKDSFVENKKQTQEIQETVDRLLENTLMSIFQINFF